MLILYLYLLGCILSKKTRIVIVVLLALSTANCAQTGCKINTNNNEFVEDCGNSSSKFACQK